MGKREKKLIKNYYIFPFSYPHFSLSPYTFCFVSVSDLNSYKLNEFLPQSRGDTEKNKLKRNGFLRALCASVADFNFLRLLLRLTVQENVSRPACYFNALQAMS